MWAENTEFGRPGSGRKLLELEAELFRKAVLTKKTMAIRAHFDTLV
jgi:hypothetical protein